MGHGSRGLIAHLLSAFLDPKRNGSNEVAADPIAVRRRMLRSILDGEAVGRMRTASHRTLSLCGRCRMLASSLYRGYPVAGWPLYRCPDGRGTPGGLWCRYRLLQTIRRQGWVRLQPLLVRYIPRGCIAASTLMPRLNHFGLSQRRALVGLLDCNPGCQSSSLAVHP